jgi:Tfp pilus assembly protein PilP
MTWGLTITPKGIDHMKTFAVVIAASATLALAACGTNRDDALNNVQENQAAAEELNQLADEAANDAVTEAEALSAQQEQLNQPTAAPPPVVDERDPAEDEDVTGM